MTQVFISYSRRDLDFVEQLAVDLKAADLDVWYDLSGLGGGVRFQREIKKAIRASQYLIVVLSSDSVASEWVEREYLLANKLGLKIIPLYYKRCDLPLYFLSRQYIDVRGKKYKQNYSEILQALDEKELHPKTYPKISPKIIIIFIGAIVLISGALGFPQIKRWFAASPTPTVTTTSTVTKTFTPFVSPSPTLTPTFILTNTATFTATLTNTATITPTPTRTATSTLSSTPTPAFACDTINEIPAYGTAIKRGKNFKVGFTIVNTGNSVWPEETELRLGSNPYGMVDVPSALPKIPRLEPDDTIKVGPFDAKAPDQVGFYIVSFTLGDGSCNPFITFNIVK